MTIPKSVQSIGYTAFRNCCGLKTVNHTGSEEEWKAIEPGEQAFFYYDETDGKTYPLDCKQLYCIIVL